MEKILLIIDAQNFKPEILDFVAGISEPGKSRVAGVFLFDDMLKATPYIRSIGGQTFVEEIILTDAEIKERDEVMLQCSRIFKEECRKRSINMLVHKDHGNPLKRILKESRYADLIITDTNISFSTDNTFPTKFVKELLTAAECPVLIAPEYYNKIDEVVFAYDGSKSSVAAIKQFCYHLPKLTDKKIVVLHFAAEMPEIENVFDKSIFEEWLKMKFVDYSFVTIPGDSREGVFTYFMDHRERSNSLLVMGAFGRGLLSTFFRPSTSELVLRAIDIPVFITHV